MTFQDWECAIPEEIKGDKVWRMKAYRLALFAVDIGWHDVSLLLKDLRMRGLSDQLYRALGSVSANIEEGYARGSGKDRARFYEYALGSARESRGWYYKGRHVLAVNVVTHRMQILTEITESVVSKTAKESVTVEHPTMSLEQFFIGVIEKARSVSGETSGAKVGGQVAGYLRGEERLEQLAHAEAAPEATETQPAPETKVAEDRLRELGAENAKPTAKESSSEESKPETKDKSEVNKRLQNLLGDDSPTSILVGGAETPFCHFPFVSLITTAGTRLHMWVSQQP